MSLGEAKYNKAYLALRIATWQKYRKIYGLAEGADVSPVLSGRFRSVYGDDADAHTLLSGIVERLIKFV